MSIDLGKQLLVMIFRRELFFGFLPKASGDSFQVDEVEFSSLDANHLTAFCDRLLDGQDQLVGVQITPISEPAEHLMHAVQNAPYVTAEAGGFQVWLSEAPLNDARNNAEQAFGGQVFRNAAGEFALSIDADFLLTPADESQLLNSHAKWVAISQ
jgi:hypothetical protein